MENLRIIREDWIIRRAQLLAADLMEKAKPELLEEITETEFLNKEPFC